MLSKEDLKQKYSGCPNTSVIADKCTCKNETCVIKALCCACIEFHRDYSKTPLPHCIRELDGVTWEARE